MSQRQITIFASFVLAGVGLALVATLFYTGRIEGLIPGRGGDAATGPEGPSGTAWYWGSDDPYTTPPEPRGDGFSAGDLYLNTTNYDLWASDGAGWGDAPISSFRLMLAGGGGPAEAEPAEQGLVGPAGTVWYYGSDSPYTTPPEPRGDGFNAGDLYLNATNYDVWESDGQGWGDAPISSFALMLGGAGLGAGSQGLVGPGGTVWYWGTGGPYATPPQPREGFFTAGDLYLNTTNYDVWASDGETWGSTPISSLGPLLGFPGGVSAATSQGQAGPPGPPGPIGPVGSGRADWPPGEPRPGGAAGSRRAARPPGRARPVRRW